MQYLMQWYNFLFSYEQWLQEEAVHVASKLQKEIADCCEYNLIRKFEIVCKVMKENGIKFDTCFWEGESCFHFAVGSYATEVCLKLMEEVDDEYLMHSVKSDKFYKGLTGLHCAVVNGMESVVRSLMERLDNTQRQKLMDTHITGTYFIKDINVSSLCLHLACWVGNENIFNDLLSYGAELDARDSEGNTVLHILVKLGKCDQDKAECGISE
jgi:ankyrin repeat protein